MQLKKLYLLDGKELTDTHKKFIKIKISVTIDLITSMIFSTYNKINDVTNNYFANYNDFLLSTKISFFLTILKSYTDIS